MEGNNFSLLFPDEKNRKTFKLEEQARNDLELEYLFDFITTQKQYVNAKEILKRIILNIPEDSAVISYRQDIFQYLLEYPVLLEAFASLLPIIRMIRFYKETNKTGQQLLYIVISRICELESFLQAIDVLKNVFDRIPKTQGADGFSSAGLTTLYAYIKKIHTDEYFLHLKENLPAIAASAREIKSITIGVNLGSSMRPTAAVLVSLNKKRFSDSPDTLFGKLIGKQTDDLRGLAPLRSTNSDGILDEKKFPFLQQLLNDMADLIEKACAPIQKALSRYIKINTRFIIDLQDDLVFYICCAHLLLTIREKGLNICRPRILPHELRAMGVENSFNINLAVHMIKADAASPLSGRMVYNRIGINDDGRILLITGPNQGGKTIFTQGAGLIQIMFQSGLFVPGSDASISPVDNIFTHFQLEETIVKQTGRFADEAGRLHGILQKATSTSLILLNESFASTNYTESLCIARDIMKVFRILGARVIFSTHFHDLAAEVDAINSEIEGTGKLVSLVSMVEKSRDKNEVITRTFRIIRHPPIGKSYAEEIALKYGINFDRLISLLEERGVIRKT